MSRLQRWRRRSVLLAGFGLAGVSLTSLATLRRSAEEGNQSTAISPEADRERKPEAPLRLGWSAWADAEVVSLMAASLIQSQLDVPVERVMADIGIQFASLARGDLDLMLMAWLPGTHRNYWNQVRDRVLDLGPMYTGRLGWVVPSYVPGDVLSSVEQLKDSATAARFGNRVQGIDPGSGLNQASREALQVYELSVLELVASSSAAMTAVLSQAITEERWLIATSWTPHWMFARFDLRFLEDPKGIFGGTERIHALARLNLDQMRPEVTAFLSRFHLPEQDLDGLLLKAQDDSPEAAVEHYLDQNPERVRYWITGLV